MTISFSGGVQLSQGVNLAVTEYDPSFLYLLGGTGAWYDPSDLTTMYQDSSGTTPVTDVGQQVGLLLDKSQSLVLGPELVTNGTFDSNLTGWTQTDGGTKTQENGVAKINITSGAGAFTGTLDQTLTVVSGRTYLVSGNITKSGGSGKTRVLIGGVEYPFGGLTTNESRTITAYVTASTTSLTVSLSAYADGGVNNIISTFDNISVKLLPGNHATQATAAQRPILGRNPITGTRNLLTYTEQFDNAVWGNVIGGTGVNPVVTVDAGTSPISEVTADRIQFNLGGGTTTADISRRRQNITLAAGSHTFSVYLKSFDGSSTYNMHLTDASGVTRNITVTGSWQRFDVSGVAAGGIVAISIGLRGGQSPANNNTADVLVWGAQLETGSTATAYQKVVSQYDVTETGVTDAYYLAFDGSDDWMITNTITPGIDKAQVFAGVRKLSDAATASVIGTSTAPFGNNGCIELYAPLYGNGYGFGARGTTWSDLSSSGTPAPDQAVITGISDIVSPSIRLRRNGVNIVSNTFTQGTGNFLAYPLYIGRRGGTSGPFNGRIYALIVRFGGNLDSTIISDTETWVNSKTGAY